MLKAKELRQILQIGITLCTEKDRNRLLETMLATAMELSNCDAGTLYLYKDETLVFKIMKTLSQHVSRGENGEPVDLPPVALREENVCAYSAIHRELVNIPDVYTSDRFDFAGPRRYDAITGYRTGSMLVIPMLEAEGELIGVLQLMNKQDGEGTVIPFDREDEFVLQSLGSMAAISLANMIYIDEIREQMRSFVQAFATAVDQRTPYNGSHTRKVTIYAGMLARQLNRLQAAGSWDETFDDLRLERLELAATLHDLGKMIVPLSVMNKATRLEEKLPAVEQRFAWLETLYDRDRWQGRISAEEYEKESAVLTEGLALVRRIDKAGFLPDPDAEAIRTLAARKYRFPDGTELAYLTPEETECLLIRKGTLTAAEREIMESHAVYTGKILAKVRFRRQYEKVPLYAATHHEYLNGSGYPDHLKGDQLETETRILTVADVYDALTSADRPYKAPIPRPKAFAILRDMVKDGQLDGRLVDALEQALEGISQEEIETRAAELE